MIRQRVRAGLSVIKDKLGRDGKFESKRGIVRTKLGRPGAEPGNPSVRGGEEVGLGVGTVHRFKREIGGHATH